jgi:hypothetical protein
MHFWLFLNIGHNVRYENQNTRLDAVVYKGKSLYIPKIQNLFST